jgi:hypothetical protein
MGKEHVLSGTRKGYGEGLDGILGNLRGGQQPGDLAQEKMDIISHQSENTSKCHYSHEVPGLTGCRYSDVVYHCSVLSSE